MGGGLEFVITRATLIVLGYCNGNGWTTVVDYNSTLALLWENHSGTSAVWRHFL